MPSRSNEEELKDLLVIHPADSDEFRWVFKELG